MIKPNNTLKEFTEIVNPVTTGWINYYGKYHASELWVIMRHIETEIMRWFKKKYEELKRNWKKAKDWVGKVKHKQPSLFKHWQWMRRHDLDGRAV